MKNHSELEIVEENSIYTYCMAYCIRRIISKFATTVFISTNRSARSFVQVSETENLRKNLAIERMIVSGCDILLDVNQVYVREGTAQQYTTYVKYFSCATVESPEPIFGPCVAKW